MAIAYDATSNGYQANGTSLTFSHTCSGSDMILIVCAHSEDTQSDCTYNGVSMSVAVNNGTTNKIYYLVNPATGAHDVVLTQAGSYSMSACATSFTGVDQTNPIDGTASSAATVTNVSTNITTSDANSFLVDSVLHGNYDSISPDASQTSRFLSENWSSSSRRHAVSTKQTTTAGTQTMSWTSSSSYTYHLIVGVSAKVVSSISSSISTSPSTSISTSPSASLSPSTSPSNENTVFQKDTDGTLTTNLLAYYNLNSDSNDFYWNKNGTETNVTHSAGKVSNCAVYNGSAKSDFGSNFSFERTDSFSVSFWWKSSQTNAVVRFLIGKESTTDRTLPGWGIFAYAGLIYFQASNSSGSSLQCSAQGVYIADGNWHHVVITYNGNSLTTGVQIVIDGTARAKTTDTNNLTSSIITSVNARIGATATDTDFTTSSFDEVGIWNKVLSATEISDLYNSGSGQTMFFSSPSSSTSTSPSTSVSPSTSLSKSPSRSLSSSPSASVSPSSSISPSSSPSSSPSLSPSPSVSPSNPQVHFQIDTSGTLKSGLQHYYKLEDGVDFYQGLNLDNTGTTTFSAGQVNNCAVFDANPQYLHTATQWIPTMSLFSLSFWVYISGTSLNGCFLINGRNNNVSGNGVGVGVGSAGTGGNWGSAGNQLIVLCGGIAWQPTGTNLGTGWHHVIVTRDGTTMRAYLDNVQTGTLTASTATPTTPTNGSFIGTSDNSGGTNYQFAGKVDEVGIWNKVLTAQEMTDLYNSGSGQTMISVFSPSSSVSPSSSISSSPSPSVSPSMSPSPDPGIAYDNTTDGGQSVGSNLTFSHTCSGDNRFLIVVTSNHSTGTISEVTYGGVNLTKSVERDDYGSIVALWYLANPATGANNVVVSGNATYRRAIAVSYTGVDQMSPINVTKNDVNVTTSTTMAMTLTTTVDNCWVVLAGVCYYTPSAGSGTTLREYYPEYEFYADSNGAVTPAGDKTLNMSQSSSADWSSKVMLSFKPKLSGGSSPSSSISLSISNSVSPSTSPSSSISTSPSLSISSSPSLSVSSSVSPSSSISLSPSSSLSLSISLSPSSSISLSISPSSSLSLSPSSSVSLSPSASMSGSRSTSLSSSVSLSPSSSISSSPSISISFSPSSSISGSLSISPSTSISTSVSSSVSPSSSISSSPSLSPSSSESSSISSSESTSISSSLSTSPSASVSTSPSSSISSSPSLSPSSSLSLSPSSSLSESPSTSVSSSISISISSSPSESESSSISSSISFSISSSISSSPSTSISLSPSSSESSSVSLSPSSSLSSSISTSPSSSESTSLSSSISLSPSTSISSSISLSPSSSISSSPSTSISSSPSSSISSSPSASPSPPPFTKPRLVNITVLTPKTINVVYLRPLIFK